MVCLKYFTRRIVLQDLHNRCFVVTMSDSPVVRLLKCCNQDAIAAPLIELKFTLGFENTTKDVASSWHILIVVGTNDVSVV